MLTKYNSCPRSEFIEASDERSVILYDILEFCRDRGMNPPDFLESVEDYIIKCGYMTGKQYNVLVDIYRSLGS